MRELSVHVVGVIVTALGLYLFFTQEKVGAGEHSEREAGATLWKIQATGPSTLILVVIGLIVFLFPFWLGSDPVAAPPTTNSTTTTTSLVVEPTTTTTTIPVDQIDPNFFTPNFPVYEFIPDGFDLIYPSAPYDVRLAEDWERLADGHEPASQCSINPAIVWEPGDVNIKVDWYLEIDAYDGETYLFSEVWDSAIHDWIYGWTPSGQAWPGWCFWEGYDPTLTYDVWVYAYNENGFSDPGYILITP